MTEPTVRRLDFGYVVHAPTIEGDPPHVVPCLGYVVTHPGGVLLFDTGIGEHPRIDARFQPRRHVLPEALDIAGVRVDDITHVVNCHLHFDHCGGNPRLAGRPIFTQRAELAAARSIANYTVPDLLDAPGTTYEELDGDAEILPGVHIWPTPGHTDGHQSLIVRRTDGTIVVAGQSHDTAAAYGRDVLSERARRLGEHHPEPASVPDWLRKLSELDPRRVVFAHDNSVWEPSDLAWR